MTKSKKSKIRKMGKQQKKQWNFCTNLLGKTKQKYFCNLDIKDLNYNKKFLKKIKHFFLDKDLQTNNIIFKDKNILVTDSSIVANTFNNYIINITDTLNLKPMPKSKSLSDLLKLLEDHFRVLKNQRKI